MESFTFLRLINDEVKTCIDDLTHNTNIFIKDIHVQEEKTIIKYAFIDIEVLTPELPDVEKAKYPVSLLTIYNSPYF